MIVRDWRDAPAELLAPVFEGERQRWLRTLQWDTAASWREVEQARTTWGLPGLIALDGAGQLRGFTFFVAEHDRIDIGGIASDQVGATDALLDGILTAAQETGVSAVRILAFDSAAALASGLRVRGFDVQQHLYLSRSLDVGPGFSRTARHDPGSPDAPAFDTWRDADVEPVARLLRRAYDRECGVLFAPHNEVAEWEGYVRNLVAFGACGVLNREATRILRDGDAIRAVALMTDISPGTAHLVQLAVDPDLRGRRMGRTLVDTVCTTLAARQYRSITLMVSAANARGRELYDTAGFRHDATFVAGTVRATQIAGTTGADRSVASRSR